MINKLFNIELKTRFDHFADFSVIADSANSTYNTLPHNQGFEF